MLREKENRDSNLLTTYGCRKRTGEKKKKENQQRMKSKPWVIAEGILLSCMPQFSILLLLPPVLFTLVSPEDLPAAISNKTFLFWRGDSIGEHGLEQPTPCCHTWEDPELIKINNNNTIFSQSSKQPWQNFFQVWQGRTWIHFMVIVMPHGLIRSAGCLSAICSLPKASTCQHKLQHWLSNGWQTD